MNSTSCLQPAAGAGPLPCPGALLPHRSQEANFADLAAQYAEGPEKKTNGIVGPVPLSQAHAALAERLRTSTPGILVYPFQIGNWWLVLRLESYTPASFDDATAQRMSEELFNQWIQEETTRKMGELQASVL